MKRRKLHKPTKHIHRRCTRCGTADSRRLLNACALGEWTQPDRFWENYREQGMTSESYA